MSEDAQFRQLHEEATRPRLQMPSKDVPTTSKRLLLRDFVILRTKELEQKEEIIESQYAHIAFFTSVRMQDMGLFNIEVSVPELGLELTQDMEWPTLLITKDQVAEFVQKQNVVAHAKRILDHLVVNMVEEKAVLEIDHKMEAFSSLLAQMRQQQFDESVA